MDLKSITWVGNIYQKFEAMCLEVEDIMCQETAKYVENQVQNVGVSVKRFYAEVMQDLDLVPPSSVVPVKEEGSDLSLEQNADFGTYKKSKIALEEDTIKENPPNHKVSNIIAPAVKDPTQASLSSGVVKVNRLFLPSSLDPVKGAKKHAVDMYAKSKTSIKEDPIKEKPPPPEVSNQASLLSEVSNKNLLLLSSSVDPVNEAGSEVSLQHDDNVGMYKNSMVPIEEKSIKKKPPQPEVSEIISSAGKGPNQASSLGDIFSIESNGIESSTTSQSVSLMGSRSGHGQCSEHTESEDFLSLPKLGRSEDNNSDLDEDNDALELGMETIEDFHNSKLEESCIVVDSKELCFVPCRAGNHKSYKKKIRDAFGLRLRSVKKQEYEQLAISYEDIDSQHSAESSTMLTLTKGLDSKKLETHDFRESEWELL